MNKAQLKEAVCRAIDERFTDIDQISTDIFAEPELGFKEQKTIEKIHFYILFKKNMIYLPPK